MGLWVTFLGIAPRPAYAVEGLRERMLYSQPACDGLAYHPSKSMGRKVSRNSRSNTTSRGRLAIGVHGTDSIPIGLNRDFTCSTSRVFCEFPIPRSRPL